MEASSWSGNADFLLVRFGATGIPVGLGEGGGWVVQGRNTSGLTLAGGPQLSLTLSEGEEVELKEEEVRGRVVGDRILQENALGRMSWRRRLSSPRTVTWVVCGRPLLEKTMPCGRDEGS